MKLLNIGERSFITPYGAWEPMGILEVPEDKAGLYLAYTGEVKVLEDVIKAEVEKPIATPKQTKKKAK